MAWPDGFGPVGRPDPDPGLTATRQLVEGVTGLHVPLDDLSAWVTLALRIKQSTVLSLAITKDTYGGSYTHPDYDRIHAAVRDSLRPAAKNPTKPARGCAPPVNGRSPSPGSSAGGYGARMEWQVHGRRPVYRSEWAELWLDDVEIPGGRRFEHHVVRFSKTCVTAVCLDTDGDRPAGQVLMLWRHRFITDRWGWELPAGWCEPDEDPAEAIRREVLEETGWRAGQIRPLTAYHAANGISDLQYTSYLVTSLSRVGEPEDRSESSRVEWVPLADVPKLAADGALDDGAALTALSYYLGIWRRSDG